MGRSSNKPQRFTGGGDAPEAPPETQTIAVSHSAQFEQKQLEMLLNQKGRLTWDEFKEKHKSQLEDRMGVGIERQSMEYRKQLDAERNAKLSRGTNKKGLEEELKEKKRLKKEKKEEKKRKKKEKKERKESKKDKKDKKRGRSSSSSSSSDSEDESSKKKAKSQRSPSPEGPVRLSDFHSGKYD